jgi:hypothetical protein
VITVLFSATLLTTSAFAADHRDASHRARAARHPHKVDTGIRPAPPLYYVEAPPRYVQDLRTGAPGQYVVRQPGFLEQLFGLRGDGYY